MLKKLKMSRRVFFTDNAEVAKKYQLLTEITLNNDDIIYTTRAILSEIDYFEKMINWKNNDQGSGPGNYQESVKLKFHHLNYSEAKIYLQIIADDFKFDLDLDTYRSVTQEMLINIYKQADYHQITEIMNVCGEKLKTYFGLSQELYDFVDVYPILTKRDLALLFCSQTAKQSGEQLELPVYVPPQDDTVFWHELIQHNIKIPEDIWKKCFCYIEPEYMKSYMDFLELNESLMKGLTLLKYNPILISVLKSADCSPERKMLFIELFTDKINDYLEKKSSTICGGKENIITSGMSFPLL